MILGEQQKLNNKWVVITGGAGHLGLMMHKTARELGGKTILLDQIAPADTTVIEDIEQQKCYFIQCDLEDAQSVTSAVERIISVCGNALHCLVNNAAFVGTSNLEGWAVPFEQQSVDTFQRCMNVNIMAPFLLSQKLAPLLAKEQGNIINISSIYSILGPKLSLYDNTKMGNPAAYAVSKAGLNQLTRWLAAVLAPSVRVNSLILGGIERGQPDSFVEQYNQHNLLNRMATEDDVRGAIAYLMTDLSSYVTGESITIDGGWSTT